MLKIVKLVIDVNLQQCILPKIHEISGNNIQLIKPKKQIVLLQSQQNLLFHTCKGSSHVLHRVTLYNEEGNVHAINATLKTNCFSKPSLF